MNRCLLLFLRCLSLFQEKFQYEVNFIEKYFLKWTEGMKFSEWKNLSKKFVKFWKKALQFN